MNILFVTASYYPAVRYGGPTYTVHSLARALVERGNRVVVFTTDADGDQRVEVPSGAVQMLDGVEVRYFRSAFRKIYWSSEMIRALKANVKKFDIVQAHAAFIYPTVAARRAAVRAGIPFVFSPRGMLVYDLIKRKNVFAKIAWMLLFEVMNCRAASFVHATSDLEACEIRKLRLRPKRIEVIPNGVNISREENENVVEACGKEVASTLQPYILILGRVSWKKGIDRLIRAMSFVPSVRLVVAGNDDENYTSRLQGLVRKQGLQNRVHFVGPAYGKDKFAWMRGAEIFVLPSYSESFGVVVIEAMACGCPVIMTPEVGVAEEVQEAGAGMIAPGSPDQIGKAINLLLADPTRRNRMGEIGRQVAADIFSWHKVANAMEAAYRRSIADVART